MVESTLEQRVLWLQQGLREIGKLCLQLGDGDQATVNMQTGAPGVPAGPGDDARATQNTMAGAVSLNDFLAQVQD